MKKRLFLLITISLFAFGLVSLALVGASAASAEKPTGVDRLTPATNPTFQDRSIYQHLVLIKNPAQRTQTPGLSLVDQMRQGVMDASHSPEDLDRVEFWLNQSSMSYMWGHADPGATITITTPLEQFNAFADSNGDWWTDAHELYPGDDILVVASPGFTVTIMLSPTHWRRMLIHHSVKCGARSVAGITRMLNCTIIGVANPITCRQTPTALSRQLLITCCAGKAGTSASLTRRLVPKSSSITPITICCLPCE
jgi:hypothetical protein